MDPRALVAVVCAFLSVILGPHLFLLLGFTVAAAALLGVGYCIARVVQENGWGVVPVRRTASSWLQRASLPAVASTRRTKWLRRSAAGSAR